MTDYPEAERILHVLHDPQLPAVSLNFDTQTLISGAAAPFPCHWAFLRGSVEGMRVSSAPLSNILWWFLRLKAQGLASLRTTVQSKHAIAKYLADVLKQSPYVELLTEPSNHFRIRFRFNTPTETPDLVKTNNVNAMLYDMFIRSIERRAQDPLHFISSDESGNHYFEYDQTCSLGLQEVDGLAALFQRGGDSLQSVIRYSAAMHVALQQIPSIELISDATKPPLAVACFRLLPEFYKTIHPIEQYANDINRINEKLGATLQATNPVFQTVHIGRLSAVLVAVDRDMTVVFTGDDIPRLAEQVRQAASVLENDEEILGKVQEEITKRGIEVAMEQIVKMKQEEAAQESVWRILPGIGGITNWLVPTHRESTGSLSFDLRTSTLTKQQPSKTRGTSPAP
eukprot:TRINITY_DN15503_c0_g1_i2.p2 TRINITY_DN15503_c0_g1~~TRINITY_DN15503_c0_g1_i2.p2  ORF type:complete len:398 (+),score=74.00 TRINITY_DN15503_c0_g1_i2:1552-2745(+)